MNIIFENITVAGIPLLLVVIGLVQYIKGFGLQGNSVRALSGAVGLVLVSGIRRHWASRPILLDGSPPSSLAWAWVWLPRVFTTRPAKPNW